MQTPRVIVRANRDGTGQVDPLHYQVEVQASGHVMSETYASHLWPSPGEAANHLLARHGWKSIYSPLLDLDIREEEDDRAQGRGSPETG